MMRESEPSVSATAMKLHNSALVVDGCFPIHTGPLGYSEDMLNQARQMIAKGNRFSDIRQRMSVLYDEEMLSGSTDFWDWWGASGATAFHTTVGRVEGGTCPEAFDTAVREIAVWQRRFDTFDALIKVVRASDIKHALEDKKPGIILGFQNSTHFMGDLRNVDLFYALGVRIVQLTYNLRNRAGDGCTERSDAGLSHFGKQLVKKLNETKILIDLSHCGEATCRDAIEASDRPMAFTHATCKTIYDHVRAKSDDLLRLLSTRAGYMGILLIPSFLAPRQPSIEDFIDHLVHAASIMGIDNVGIGTDRGTYPQEIRDVIEREKAAALAVQGVTEVGWRDGDFLIPEPSVAGYRDWRDLPKLTDAMLQRGFSEEEVRGVLGLNFVRVFRDAVS